MLDDDPLAQDYARRTGQDAGHEPRPEDPTRHADFGVSPDADGNIGTKEIMDALERLERKADGDD